MNHAYRIVWNPALACWQAVAEIARSFGKSASGKPLLLALSLLAAPAWAGPQGGQVTAGSATIQQSGVMTTINQSSAKAAIDWSSFSVGKSESVRFNQPSASAITLNRVTGTESSQILGNLTANGQVFILNPNGVLFGQGAQVNVGGLVASTRNMSNADFMAGNYQLTGTGTGSVVNQGAITVPEGGTIALIAPVVQNTGMLNAPQGSVLLAAADAVTLKLQDGSLIGYTLDKGSLQALVDNGGIIQANGGHVVLTAKGLDALSKATINHSGVIEAQTVSSKNGVVELLGDMETGQINLSGKIDASAPKGGGGGFVETSAARLNLAESHQVTTLAANGQTGTWLIDPNDFTIAASGGNITGTQLSSDLGSSNIAISTATQGTAGGHGDIHVNDSVNWSANKLTLSAERNININANLNGSGTASLALEYGQGAVAAGNAADYFINNGAKVSLATGNNFSTKLGSDGATDVYTVITSLGVAGDTSTTTLQGMKNNLTGKYALGADIDASATAGWNSGAGWEPASATYWSSPVWSPPFSGAFSGLGHVISSLTINRPSQFYVGLFGASSAEIRDIGLVGGSVSAHSQIGGLVGYNSGVISNAYNTGSVLGLTGDVGGLIGSNYGKVKNSYSTGNVSSSGSANIGGLVGYAGTVSSISNAYNSGNVNCSGADCQAGGLVGYNSGGTIVDSHNSGGVTGSDPKSVTGGLVGQNDGPVSNSYSTGSVTGNGLVGGLYGLPFATSTNSFYNIDQVSINGHTGVVTFGGVYNPQWVDWFASRRLDVSTYFGSADSNGYYTVSSIPDFKNLLGVSDQSGLKFKLSADLDFSANSGLWLPQFRGDVFEGNNHVVRNWHVNLPTFGVGFVGRTDSATTLRNFEIDTGLANGAGPVGLLVAWNGGTVSNSHSSGAVSVIKLDFLQDSGGGLVGANEGSVSNSYSIGSVRGGNVGGLVGHNLGGTISNSYSTGSVSGSGAVGGLVGINAMSDGGGTISNSYSTGSVSGSIGVGGLVGENDGTISNSYSTGSVSGLGYLGGLVGLGTGTINTSYSTGAVSGSDHVGGLVGSGGTISNSYSTGAVSGTEFVGGLVGLGDATISDSYSTGAVSGDMYVGGLVGVGGTIRNSYSTSDVVGRIGFVGGLVGANEGTISNSYSIGAISGSADGVGGLVGWNGGTITSSYSTGAVSGGMYVGGLVGTNGGTIGNSYSTGAVSGPDVVGGLVGYNVGTISNSYSTGAAIGGLVGWNDEGTISNSYWNTQTSGQSVSAGGTGKTTAEMKQQATFSDWDFSTIWRIYEGLSYPVLRVFQTDLTVTANSAAKTYDGAAYSGGNGVTQSTPGALTGAVTYGGTSQGSTNAGSYAITPNVAMTQPEFQNWNVSYVDGTLTIAPASAAPVPVVPVTPPPAVPVPEHSRDAGSQILVQRIVERPSGFPSETGPGINVIGEGVRLPSAVLSSVY